MASLVELVRFLQGASRGISRSRLKIVVVLVSGVASGLASAGLVALINEALDTPALERGELIVPFLAGCLALPAARALSSIVLIRLTQGMVYELRMGLSRQILATPLRRLEKLGSPRLLAILTDDVGEVAAALANIPLLLMHTTVVMGLLGYLGWLSWRLLLVVLVFVVIGLMSYQLPIRHGLRHYRLRRERWDLLFKHFEGLTQGNKELKMHRKRRHEFLQAQLEPVAAAYRSHSVAGGSIYAWANSWGQILFFVLIGLLLFVLTGVEGDTSIITGYTLAILYMMTPLDVVLQMFPGLSRAGVGVEKIQALGTQLEESRSPEVEGGERVEISRLDLVGVTHVFQGENEDEKFILGPIDLTVTPGELVFVIGGNGSGKTTFAKLLTGLYAAESGEIRVDGEPVTDGSRDAYRQLFTTVFSDFYLFESLLGLDADDLDERAQLYLSQLHLASKLQVSDGRLSTLNLSQGQRKRLALVTAFLEDRPIYLFDEWAADQDPNFKRVFYHEILPALRRRGKVVLVISHDDRYYDTADRIVKLEAGTIIYDGPSEGFLGSPRVDESLAHAPDSRA
ncbi:MAG: cyclic peptide export ABC transporter [bacterium]